MDSQNTFVRKETKNKIHVDYEGKLSFKERLKSKAKAIITRNILAIKIKL